MKLLLAFSGAYLLGVLVLEMLPEIYHHALPSTGYWLLGGIIVQNILEFFSKGAEHGHVHHHPHQNRLWVLMISLCIHALLEGLPLAVNQELLWAVSIHKFLIAMVLALLFLQTPSKGATKAGALLLFALMTPLGSSVAYLPRIASILPGLTSFVVGLLLHISTTILFESAEGHTFNGQKFISILLGMGLAAVV